ncbi:hypothetical protein FQV27_05645 [Paracoccus aurantiacus]|uniref:Uncharacterized protein n=1 Tax=Paracoccus aurantiacus TaxID=2599412 RepID=A0A5C6S575_9RHOB|nr:hypothetical protein [Paracoccus aurantiacus]TXB69605.1 hypothetical protein FQV27_05645 [Paracoccus aurantiacus]
MTFQTHPDLLPKFSTKESTTLPTVCADFAGADVALSEGQAQLVTPLGKNRQRFANSAPAYSDQVTVLGDSHSSIFAQRRLTYLFASAFETVEFAWNPTGNAGIPDLSASRNIVLEMSQRFLFPGSGRAVAPAIVRTPPASREASDVRAALARAIWRLGVDDASLPDDLVERNEMFLAGFDSHIGQAKKLEALLGAYGYKIVRN